MEFTRRDTLSLGLAGVALAVLPVAARAEAQALIEQFTGGAPTGAGQLTLIAPEIAENGNSVTIEVSCPGAEAIRLLAPANPNPEVCTFRFGPLAGNTAVTTRIRMADTQEIIALAQMADGSFQQTSALVRVTIGGCGG